MTSNKRISLWAQAAQQAGLAGPRVPAPTNNSTKYRESLAKQIFEEMLSERVDIVAVLQDGKIAQCFRCGRGFVYRRPVNREDSGRFCTSLCRAAYDLHVPVGAPPIHYINGSGQRMVVADSGFKMRCRGCGSSFTSLGLRCCSAACDKIYRDTQEAARTASEIGHTARQARACETCGTRIPRYTKTGKATAAKVRWCSVKCRRMARGSQTPDFVDLTLQKPPFYGPSGTEVSRSTLPQTDLSMAEPADPGLPRLAGGAR